MSLYPKGIHSPSPISTHPDVLLLLQLHMYPFIPRASILPRPFQHIQMSSSCCCPACPASQGHPFSLAHFSTSKCPPPAAATACHLHPKGIHSPFTISTHPDVLHAAAALHVSHPKGIHSPSPFQHIQMSSIAAALQHVISSQGHPFSLAHFNTSKCPPSCSSTDMSLIPRASILPSPFQHIQMSSSCSMDYMSSASQGHPFSLAHFNTSKCPPLAAAHACPFIPRAPFSLAHFNTSRCPPSAASVHVHSSQGHPFSLAHFNTSKCPPLAAAYMSPHPKGIHSPLPISTHPNVLLLQHAYMYFIPRASILPCPFQHIQMSSSCSMNCMSIHPKGIHSPLPISTHPDVLHVQLHCMSIHPKGIHSPSTISAHPDGLLLRLPCRGRHHSWAVCTPCATIHFRQGRSPSRASTRGASFMAVGFGGAGRAMPCTHCVQDRPAQGRPRTKRSGPRSRVAGRPPCAHH